MAIVAVIRWRLADAPLERDEGEYAYMGQLILRGITPFEQAFNMKFPGIYYAYALAMAAFGQTAWAIRIGLLIVNATTIWLMFVLAKRLFSPGAAVVAALTFAALSLDPWTMGPFAHATHFVVLFVVAAWIVLVDALSRPTSARAIGAGLLLGLAIVMSQQAIVFAIAAVALLFLRWRAQPVARSRRALSLMVAGAAAPVALMLLAIVSRGLFGRFWWWVSGYGRAYALEQTPALGWAALTQTVASITQAAWPMWILPIIGFAVLMLRRSAEVTKGVVGSLLLAGVISVSAGLYFRPHYFVLVLPAAALLAAAACDGLSFGRSRVMFVVSAAAFGLFAVLEEPMLSLSAEDLSRRIYQGNPFLESESIGRYIHDHTQPNDRIGVLGSEPQIYFYAGRQAATGYLHMYPLLERQPLAAAMQDELIQQVTAAHPAFLVFVNGTSSWSSPAPSDDRHVITWAQQYVRNCYTLTGVADIPWPLPGRVLWDEEIRGYEPMSANTLLIYKRRTEKPCAAP